MEIQQHINFQCLIYFTKYSLSTHIMFKMLFCLYLRGTIREYFLRGLPDIHNFRKLAHQTQQEEWINCCKMHL